MAKAKILFAGDLHKYPSDKSTISGYAKVCREIEADLINIIQSQDITHFVSLGDWYDRGYGTDVSAALYDTELDRYMAKVLKGNFYGVIGNHLKLHLDTNPELFLIQPHEKYRTKQKVDRTEQIIKTPERLDIGPISIYLQHWFPEAESVLDYKPLLNPNAKFHIGVFHCQEVIPAQKLQSIGIIDGTNKGISNVLEGLNMALVGHIHKPLGTFPIRFQDSTCTMIVPGSLTNTDAGMKSRHLDVDMPLITLEDDDSVTISHITLDLRCNELQFADKKFCEENKTSIGNLTGNNLENLYSEHVDGIINDAGNSSISLNAFMTANGYTPADRALVKSLINYPNDIGKAISIVVEGNKMI